MEETILVLMEKDEKTGFLEKEIDCFKIEANGDYIINLYAKKTEGKYMVYMKLTCDRDVLDWEYNAIYDYYDREAFQKTLHVEGIEEEEDCFNPTWLTYFLYEENTNRMEILINKILSYHQKELERVYLIINSVKNEYEMSEDHEE